MATVMGRLQAAMNDHDLDAFVDCFATDYQSEQPAHPSRAFAGAEQVRLNWRGVFSGVPDFHAELLTESVVGDVEIGEWRWSGHHTDGTPFAMAGAMVLGIGGGRIAWGRLYMEPVDEDGETIDEMVEETYKPTSS